MTPDRIIGVRFRDTARLYFFSTDIDEIETGAWVAVPTGRGEEAAQVIVAPDQMLAAHFSETPKPIARVLTDDEVELMQMPVGAPSDIQSGARLIGGVGFRDPARRDVSREHERYRQAKRGLPRLGQRIEIAGKAAMVVSRDVFEKTATIRYDETGQLETIPAGDIQEAGHTHNED